MPTNRRRRGEVGEGAPRMDAPGPMDARHIPKGLEPGRAYRWCVARTARDLGQSARRGRTISLPVLCRLFVRRWLNVSDQCRPRPALDATEAGARRGRAMLRRMYLRWQRVDRRWPFGPTAKRGVAVGDP